MIPSRPCNSLPVDMEDLPVTVGLPDMEDLPAAAEDLPDMVDLPAAEDLLDTVDLPAEAPPVDLPVTEDLLLSSTLSRSTHSRARLKARATSSRRWKTSPS